MTTTTENPTKNTPTLDELLGSAPWRSNSELDELGIIRVMNNATGRFAYFPTYSKARETADWQTGYEQMFENVLLVMERDGLSNGEAIVQMINNALSHGANEAMRYDDFDDFIAENLTPCLMTIWVASDASLTLAGRELSSEEKQIKMGLGEVLSDVYGRDGISAGSELWDLLWDAYHHVHHHCVAKQKARKSQSKDSKRKAQAKARRKNRRK